MYGNGRQEHLMKLILLGGSGYLGRRLLPALSASGTDIICIRRPSSDFSFAEKTGCRIQFCSNSNEDMEELFKNNRDTECVVLNLSCSYMKEGKNDYDIWMSNYSFCAHVLLLAGQYSTHNTFMTIGTGLPDDFNIYCYAKKQLNDLGYFYSEKQMKLVKFVNIILDIFYGEDEPLSRFIPSVIQKLKQGDDIFLTAGTQRRDMIYIEDVIRALLLLITRPPGVGAAGRCSPGGAAPAGLCGAAHPAGLHAAPAGDLRGAVAVARCGSLLTKPGGKEEKMLKN